MAQYFCEFRYSTSDHKIFPHENLVPYPRERGPMGSAPYIGPRLGDGPIFEVSVSRLYASERPGNISYPR